MTNQVTQQLTLTTGDSNDPNQVSSQVTVSGELSPFSVGGIVHYNDPTEASANVKIPGQKPPDNSFFVHELSQGQSALDGKYKFILDESTSPVTYTLTYDVYSDGQKIEMSQPAGPGSKMLMFFTGEEVVYIASLVYVAPV
jgi:hypothetical protein